MKVQKKGNETKIVDVIKKNTGYSDINEFLYGKSNYEIKQLDKVSDKIKQAVKENKTITVVGDYDVDGVSASAIMYMTLKKIGAKVRVRLPRRMSEGFGISNKIVDEIKDGMIITVDNGIAAVEPIKRAKDKGLDVIITDHHLPNEDGVLPPADMVIDPHLPDAADYSDYCGAGIAYKLAEKLVDDEQFLNKMSCFAALGTISDVMKLTEDNRKIVIKGLKNMTIDGNRTTGLYAMLRKNYIDQFVTTSDIGFKIGPMINAAGRLEDKGALKPLTLLVNDGIYTYDMANELFDINNKRKQIVESSLPKFEKQIYEKHMQNDFPLVIYEPNIPEGIIGIIAGKLSEKYDTPVFAFSDSEDPTVIKGSARTARMVNIKELLDKSPEQFYKYGGHAEAAGVSIKKDNFENARKKLMENCIEPLGYVKDDTLYYDLEINFKDLPKIKEELEKYEPFGEGNPNIVFKIKDFELVPTDEDKTGIKYMGNNKYCKLLSNKISAFGDTEKYNEMIADCLLYEISKFSQNDAFTSYEKTLMGYAISYFTEFNADDKNKLEQIYDKIPISDGFRRFCNLEFDLIAENESFKKMYNFKNVKKYIKFPTKFDVIGTLSTNYFKGEKKLQIDILGLQDPERILEINKENINKNIADIDIEK